MPSSAGSAAARTDHTAGQAGSATRHTGGQAASATRRSGAEAADANRRVGLIAGWGRYPLVVAQALCKQGYQVYCLGVIGEADPALADVCHELR
ncbi:MAG: hypothetical protein ACYSWU_11795, partial [Planctomycetota bacterium]